jgi:hypothetical protein
MSHLSPISAPKTKKTEASSLVTKASLGGRPIDISTLRGHQLFVRRTASRGVLSTSSSAPPSRGRCGRRRRRFVATSRYRWPRPRRGAICCATPLQFELHAAVIMDARNNIYSSRQMRYLARHPVLSRYTLGGYERDIDRFCNWLRDHRPTQYNTMTRAGERGSRVVDYSMMDAATMKAFLDTYSVSGMMQYCNTFTWDACRRRESISDDLLQEIAKFINERKNWRFVLAKKRFNGMLMLAVFLVRARKRANDRLYRPGGTGYEICKRRYYEHESNLHK